MINELYITDVRVGVHLTAVRLSDGSAGIASTVASEQHQGGKRDENKGDFSPGHIKGMAIKGLFESELKKGCASSLMVAVLNAISQTIISKGDYNIVENTDPIDLLNLQGQKTISIVGAFQGYIRKISATAHNLNVIELNENALDDDQKKYYVPAGAYKKVLKKSDIVIITGLTLVNGTIDHLLESIPHGAQVVVVGPSGNLLPDVLFENGVDIIGATRITNPQRLLDVVGEGGKGFHLFEGCAGKICILRD